MASFGIQLSLFLLLALVLSPQIQAREGKPFSFFTHFKTIFNVKDPQVVLKKAKAPTLAPTLAPIMPPTPAPIIAPTPAPIIAPTPETESTTIPSGPAPEPEFSDRGNGYGLYGSGYTQNSLTKETPTTTTTFENELLNEDFNDDSYKTRYSNTNFYNNDESYRNNYNNNDEYKSNYNNGYNNYNGYEEGKREGMSDTRFLENGKYYYQVNTYDNNRQNYDLNGYESGRGSTESENNEGYYETNQYPNEFDTMEEYEKQQAEQGYTP